MLKKSTKSKSVKSIIAMLSASVLVMGMGFSQSAQASDPYLGTIETFAFNFPPRGWAFCDGQLLLISTHTSLFALIGTTFGGDGRTTFGLPDLRGRVAKHVGSGPGLASVSWGETGGAENRTLTVNNLPSHSHTATLHATSTRGNSANPDGTILASKPRTDIYSNAAPNVTMSASSVTLAHTGGGQALDIRNPYLGIYHSIALQGLFPSRN